MPRKATHTENSRKVVHLTSVHPPFDVRIFHKECKSIARAGYEVTLVVCHDRDETVDGVHVKALERKSGRLSRMTRGVWEVYREALRQDARLYHFHDPELMIVGLLLRLKGKQVIYDVHENVPADIAFRYYIPRPFRRPMAWLVGLIEAGAAPCFSAIVPATYPISVHLAPRNDRTVVVSNYPVVSTSQAIFQKPWAERSISVAYAGVISEDRCIKQMVEAMALLPMNLQATLKLAGAFSPTDLRSTTSKIAGWENVEELGVIDRSAVATLLDDACAGLIILRPDPNFLESAPTKLFEYMSAGIPVIASDFPGFREIVGKIKCGLLVDPLDPRSIAGAIEYILKHPAEAEQMGQRGREAVLAQYNWASEERKLLELYCNLTSSPVPLEPRR
jgi:glycosyltransferase involved in cell wall biosynthesis